MVCHNTRGGPIVGGGINDFFVFFNYQEYYLCINASFYTWYWGECLTTGLKVFDHYNKTDVPIATESETHWLRLDRGGCFLPLPAIGPMYCLATTISSYQRILLASIRLE